MLTRSSFASPPRPRANPAHRRASSVMPNRLRLRPRVTQGPPTPSGPRPPVVHPPASVFLADSGHTLLSGRWCPDTFSVSHHTVRVDVATGYPNRWFVGDRAAMRRFEVFPAGRASRHECAICFGSHELDPAPIPWPPRQRRAPHRLAPRHNVANMRASGSLHESEFACDTEP